DNRWNRSDSCSGDCKSASWTYDETKPFQTRTRRRRQSNNKHRHKNAQYNCSLGAVSPIDCQNSLSNAPKLYHAADCSSDHSPPSAVAAAAAHKPQSTGVTGNVLYQISSLKKCGTGRKKHSVKFSKETRQPESQMKAERAERFVGHSAGDNDCQDVPGISNHHKLPVLQCQRVTTMRERLAGLEMTLEDQPVDIESEIDAYSRFLFP
ncbi:unnamed protein product, partial [Schistocephalus solidus]|uniref:Potassium voltage-gated channel, subfamily H (Eag-related), member 6 n=1 Tax=Schistocephalus solidus TaxID=70667 RepID=A0A183TQR8_SCHSO